MSQATPDSSPTDSATAPNALSRRDTLKALGAGVALLGWSGGLRAQTPKATPAAGLPGATSQPFTLPSLGYPYGALEPHLDAETMEIHHTRHHQAYITAANKALAEHPSLATLSAEALLADLAALPEGLRPVVRNHVGGHVNHALFWKSLSPTGGGEPTGALATALNASFGDIEKFKAQLADAGAKRFGSGWAWLVIREGKLGITSTANQDSPLMDGATPLLGFDVWEHAYYLKYQNRRADYLKALWEVVDWRVIGQRYQAALS